MIVRVYLDKGRVSDTPVISETPRRHSKPFKQTNKHIFKLTPSLSRFPHFLLAAHWKKTSYEVFPDKKPMFCIELFFLTLDWAEIPEA